MADVPKLPKRPNYFQAQFLIVRDFDDEQTYHKEMRRRHNRDLHEWGVVRDGLTVTKTGDNQNLSISPGAAIDSLGREIVLEEAQLLSIDKVRAASQAAGQAQDVAITIAFREVDSNAPEDKYPGTDNVTRQMQSPIIDATKTPATDGTVITLARISVSGADVGQPNNAVRKEASSYIARGSNLGDITLDGALSFTSKSSPNPTYPQVGLDYDAGSDGLRIRARTKDAPALDTTHLTIKRDTGNVGIGTDAPQQRLEIHDGDGLIQMGRTDPTLVKGSNNGGAIYFGVDRTGNKDRPTAAIETSWGGGNNPQIGIGVTREFSGRPGANILMEFNGDTNIRKGETSRLFVQGGTGNVGIGTPLPQAQLQVGDSPDTALVIGDRKTAGSVGLQFLGMGYQNAGLRFDGDNIIVEDASQSFQPSKWHNPALTKNLIVRNGNVGIGSDKIPTHQLTIENPKAAASMRLKSTVDGGDFGLLIGSGKTMAYLATAQSLSLQSSLANIKLLPTGNVGIGTGNEDPTERLDVRSSGPDVPVNLRVSNSDVTSFVGIFPGQTSNPNPSIIWPTGKLLRFGTANKLKDGMTSDYVERVIITGDGSVGIGTTNPIAKLDIEQNTRTGTHPKSLKGLYVTGDFDGDNNGVEFRHTNGTQGIGFGYNTIYATGTNTDQPLVIKSRGAGNLLLMPPQGNVGIGTSNPTKAKLEVAGFVNTQVNGYGYTNRDGANVFNAMATSPYSIWASNRIASSEYNAFSDERIKNIQGRSDSATDLHTLLGIEITDYTFRDAITKGSAPRKMVIGQQVERVFPQAVSKLTDVVPDIYQQASFADGWVALSTDLKQGERVRLISDKVEGVHEVLEATPDKFRTDFQPEGDHVFVFGREVNDFRTVDYDAIAMLNVSATQQLKKEKDGEVKALRAENAELKARLDTLEAAMQRLMLSGGTPAARPDSASVGVTGI